MVLGGLLLLGLGLVLAVYNACSNSRPLEFDSSWFAHSDICSMIRHGLRGEKGVR